MYEVIRTDRKTYETLFKGSFKNLISFLNSEHYIVQRNQKEFKKGLAQIRDEGWHLRGNPFGLNLSIEKNGQETFVYDIGVPNSATRMATRMSSSGT